MTQDLNNNDREKIESTEPSPEPSQTPESEEPKSFIPRVSARELSAVYEMLSNFKKAIRKNKWEGSDVEVIAMGLTWLARMESQYQSQTQMAKDEEKDMFRKAKEEIKAAGGVINAQPS